ncbi:MAG: metal-dependent hydrolase [Candidatus Bathyarchaeota archaeon]|nr:MAG: metal-dependent hydrolase [Candidatus Bathyarchaeota archaeon]
MDLFSHGLLGFVFGQALQLDTNVQIILIISSVILDIDAVHTRRSVWLQFHRGPMHSLFSATLISLAIGTTYSFLLHFSAEVFIPIFLICLGGSFSHILLDLLTPRSLAVLWPFSNEKVVFDLTSFFDPIFLGVLLPTSIFVYMVDDLSIIRIVMVVANVLFALNFGVRYFERDAAIETVKRLNVDADSKVVPLPTLRPDRWWVAVKTQSENRYNYEIYNVDSIGNKILSHSRVESPFIDYRNLTERPTNSPQKAVAFSKRDKRVGAFIEQSRLPAVNVTLSDDGGTWQVFWYDVFMQLSEGAFKGITIKVEID